MWVSPDDYKIIGECLAAVRKAAKVSQDELAARLKKAQSFVSAYERGQRRVDIFELLLILEALEADPLTVFATIVERTRRNPKAGRRGRGRKPATR